MKRSRIILVFVSILIAISVAGWVWLRNRPVLRLTSQPNGRASTTAGVQPSQESRRTGSRPLYGKDSLSPEEKRILISSPENCFEFDCWRRAYRVGMICLKHRLMASEVDSLIPGRRFCSSRCYPLDFEFNAEGKIVRVSYWVGGSPRYLPPMESVTPDAPIELPPLPYEGIGIMSESYSNDVLKGISATEPPPDFASVSYFEAKKAADRALSNRGDRRYFDADYPLKIIEQLSDKNLTGNNKAVAIYVLGRIWPSDSNSIAALIEQIDFKVSVPYDQSDWRYKYPWSEYPARDALLQTGEASINPIVESLPGETNALRRHLLCAVVSSFGRTNWTTAWQPKTAIDQLQQLRADESDPSRQHNVDEALDLLIDNKVDLNIGWSAYFVGDPVPRTKED